MSDRLKETWSDKGPVPVLLLGASYYPGQWSARIGVGPNVRPVRVRGGRNGCLQDAQLELDVTASGLANAKAYVSRDPAFAYSPAASVDAYVALGRALADPAFRAAIEESVERMRLKEAA